MRLHALVVAEQPDVRRLVALKLDHAGFQVVSALDAQDGLARARMRCPDIVVLSLASGEESYAVARDLRSRTVDHAPAIIMLSADGRVADIAAGLASGADDYLGMPFAPHELIERAVVALIRRGRAGDLPERLSPADEQGRSRHPGAVVER